jgi:hypothetical protein
MSQLCWENYYFILYMLYAAIYAINRFLWNFTTVMRGLVFSLCRLDWPNPLSTSLSRRFFKYFDSLWSCIPDNNEIMVNILSRSETDNWKVMAKTAKKGKTAYQGVVISRPKPPPKWRPPQSTLHGRGKPSEESFSFSFHFSFFCILVHRSSRRTHWQVDFI